MPIIEDLTISKDIRLIVWEISETINDLKTEFMLSEDSLKLLHQRKSDSQKTVLSDKKYFKGIID